MRRYLQPNHFGVLALPVGEFLGLLHDAVYVGSCAVDGDIRRSPSGGSPAAPGDAAGTGRRKPAADPTSSHHFFAQGTGSGSAVRLPLCPVPIPNPPSRGGAELPVHALSQCKCAAGRACDVRGRGSPRPRCGRAGRAELHGGVCVQVPLITCGCDTPVSLAIDMMLEKRVHRVYIVDDPAGDAGKPIAIVTTTDLIAFISKNLPEVPQQ